MMLHLTGDDRQTFSVSAFIFAHKEAVSCISSGVFEAVIVEVVQMPPICHISGKLIYLTRAWRITSDNNDIVSLCQAGAKMIPAWCQVWWKELKWRYWVDPCQAKACACTSLIEKNSTELLYFLFSISSTDSFSSQNKKALNRQIWVVFSVTFTSGQMSVCEYFQDVGVCTGLLGVCLIWSASLLIIQAGICRC